MESVFHIRNCAESCQVKHVTCSLLDGALTRWNYYLYTIRLDVAYETTKEELKKMLTDEYCPRNVIQKVETELWNLTVKGIDVVDDIQGKVTFSRLSKIQEEIHMAHKLMDQVVRAKASTDADNKRKWEDNQEGNHCQQQNKRHEVVRVYAGGTSNKTRYAGTLPLCDKCNLSHYHSPCPAQCGNCRKIGHQARDCWTPTSMTCYECGEKGHTRKYCPNLEDHNEADEAY
ncbi:putative reverse transcriptase domain-containing protein [Tanacetum coccineum]|uniref:Reverse transcriptase domain-containing protein n=1 Tax=Tanacetum coccineum TaxID=301880 RepID=A0ABQ5GBR3_9ASTR